MSSDSTTKQTVFQEVFSHSLGQWRPSKLHSIYLHFDDQLLKNVSEKINRTLIVWMWFNDPFLSAAGEQLDALRNRASGPFSAWFYDSAFEDYYGEQNQR